MTDLTDFPQPPAENAGAANFIAWVFQVLKWLVARAAARAEAGWTGEVETESRKAAERRTEAPRPGETPQTVEREKGAQGHPSRIAPEEAAPRSEAGPGRSILAPSTKPHGAEQGDAASPETEAAPRPRRRRPHPTTRARPTSRRPLRPQATRTLGVPPSARHGGCPRRPHSTEGPIQNSRRTATQSLHDHFVSISKSVTNRGRVHPISACAHASKIASASSPYSR